MFSDISDKEWGIFWKVVEKITTSTEGSEAERYGAVWDKAENAASYVGLTDLVFGLESVRKAAETTKPTNSVDKSRAGDILSSCQSRQPPD